MAQLHGALGPERDGYVEPKPGIPASPSHIIELIEDMKRQNVKLIVMEPYFSSEDAESIAARVGGTVIVLAPSVGAVKEAGDYIQLFDYNIAS
jgi:ABC-type Zn uptake system ZnuABC Zn-binding protein ZnuA